MNSRLLLAIALPTFLSLLALPSVSNAEAIAIAGRNPTVSKHRTQAGETFSAGAHTLAEKAALVPLGRTAPTRSTFIANWTGVEGAARYRIDVSMNGAFDQCVNGFENVDVGTSTVQAVTGLKTGTLYYYRIRAYDAADKLISTSVFTANTAAGAGLIINPTFDSSITGNPKAAEIEAAVNSVISIYESLFSDSVTVSILFRYSNTEPDGTPLGGGALAESESTVYQIPWSEFVSLLQADATTTNDSSANASLPGSPLSTHILPSSANGRAIGLSTLGAFCDDGTFNCGFGTIDGVVTLNSDATFQFIRPPTTGEYDAMAALEHEIDEVLGFGSYLNFGGSDLRPQDLFSWSSLGSRNITQVGTRYFSINGGGVDIVDFNQDSAGDLGDWSSGPCPQVTPYVQNAFGCAGQASDVGATSPEGINLDVIGYNLVAAPTPTPSPTPSQPWGVIYSPGPGSALTSSKVTFYWSAGTSSSAYWLLIGDDRVTEPGGHNVYSSSQTGSKSIAVSNLPTDGRTLYVRLWSLIGGSWYTPPQDYTYVAYPGITMTPVISPKSGSYRKSVTVSILDGTPGAVIHYTTNNNPPATLYTGPFVVTGKGSHTVKAIATSNNAPDSNPAVVTYTIK